MRRSRADDVRAGLNYEQEANQSAFEIGVRLLPILHGQLLVKIGLYFHTDPPIQPILEKKLAHHANEQLGIPSRRDTMPRRWPHIRRLLGTPW